MKKPGKKIIVLSSVALLVIAGVIFHKWFSNRDTENFINPEVTAAEGTQTPRNIAAGDISQIDSDEDGLPDWQEGLWGSDPRKKDTDEDGTNDGTEVKSGRDPIVPGPDDETDDEIALAAARAEADTPDSTSEALSRELFLSTVYLSQNEAVTPENTESLVTNLIDNAAASFTYKVYAAPTLPYVTDNAEIVRYASDMAILQVAFYYEILAATDGILNPSAGIAKAYAGHAEKVHAMRPPKAVADAHLLVVNNFSKAAAAFEAIAQEKEDPINTALGLRIYQDAGKGQEAALGVIANFFLSSGIITSMDEATRDYWDMFLP